MTLVRANNTGRSLRQITVDDMSRRSGVRRLDVKADVDGDEALICGHLFQRHFGDGLSLHGGTVEERQAFDVESSVEAGLTCIFFLKGQVETEIGSRTFGFAGGNHGALMATTVVNTGPESFRCRSPKAQHVSHLVVHATEKWLALHAGPTVSDIGAVDRLLTDNLASSRWVVPPALGATIHDLLTMADHLGPTGWLTAEAQTIQVIAASLGIAAGAKANGERASAAGRRGEATLRRACEFIDANEHQPLGVTRIAREAGVSVSGLQALFRLKMGCGVSEYVRNRRLDWALTELEAGVATIAEISLRAGYGHPANFATAFRRRFGRSPSSAAAGDNAAKA